MNDEQKRLFLFLVLTFVTIFGIDDPGMSPFAQVTHSAAAAQAYRKFLTGAM